MQLSISTSKEVQHVSSLTVAELTGKKHGHVIRDIINLLSTLPISATEQVEIKYDSRGYKSMVTLPLDISQLLLAKYDGLARVPLRLQEESALKTIEQLLGVQLIRQFAIAGYRIDGYDAVNNTAYEIDETGHHNSTSKLKDALREKHIQEILNCKFVRIKL